MLDICPVPANSAPPSLCTERFPKLAMGSLARPALLFRSSPVLSPLKQRPDSPAVSLESRRTIKSLHNSPGVLMILLRAEVVLYDLRVLRVSRCAI